MNRPQVAALLWKDLRQTRGKWWALLLVLNLPPLAAGIVQAGNDTFATVADSDVSRFLRGGLSQHAGFVGTVGMFLGVVFAAASVAAEFNSRDVFFLLERPIRRAQVFGIKFLTGAVQTVAAIAVSFLVLMTWSYGLLLLLAPNVSLERSWQEFAITLGYVTRAIGWAGAIASAVYAATLFISVWSGKWWVSILACTALYLAVLVATRGHALDWTEAVGDLDRRIGLVFPAVVATIVFYLAGQKVFSLKELK